MPLQCCLHQGGQVKDQGPRGDRVDDSAAGRLGWQRNELPLERVVNKVLSLILAPPLIGIAVKEDPAGAMKDGRCLPT